MIDKAMEKIKDLSVEFIKQHSAVEPIEDVVVLTSFVDDGAQTRIPAETVGLSLLNIEQERTFRARGPRRLADTGLKTPESTSFWSKPLDLNLQIIFTANFSSYEESLKYISLVLQCFQRHLTYELPPSDPEGEAIQLVMELNTLPIEQQHYIWSMIGLHYLPSVIYQVRMLRIQDKTVIVEKPNMRAIDFSEEKKEVRD